MNLRLNGCRECQQLTSGDCGAHGPRTIPPIIVGSIQQLTDKDKREIWDKFIGVTEPPAKPDVVSLRDYFAAHALIALADHKAVEARGIDWLADHAYMLADAMLARR